MFEEPKTFFERMDVKKTNLKYALECILSSISTGQDLSSLQDIIQGLKCIPQGEAYEILRIFIILCGENHTERFRTNRHLHALLLSGTSSFRSLHPDEKKAVESLKKDILKATNELISGVPNFKITLKKSDMLLPDSHKFLECAVLVGKYALTYQLKSRGIIVPDTKNSTSSEIQNAIKILKKKQECDQRAFHSSYTNCLDRLRSCRNQLSNLKAAKEELHSLIRKKVMVIKDEINCDSDDMDVILSSLKHEADVLHERNLKTVERLRILKENYDNLLFLMSGQSNSFTVDNSALPSDLLVATQGSNTETGARGQLDLAKLLQAIKSSTPLNVLKEKQLPDSLNLGPLLNRANESQRLFVLLHCKLRYWLIKNPLHSGIDIDRDEVDKWFKSFFITVPAITFHNVNGSNPSRRSDFKLSINKENLNREVDKRMKEK